MLSMCTTTIKPVQRLDAPRGACASRGRERRRSKFVITTPILSNHWKNVFMDARIENTRRKCARKLVNGLTLNILDKCRQGLNLSTKRSNALCGTIFNYSPLSTSACLLRSKSTVIAWSSSRYVWQQNIKKLMKIWGWPAPACCLLRYHEQTRSTHLGAPRGAGSSWGGEKRCLSYPQKRRKKRRKRGPILTKPLEIHLLLVRRRKSAN